MPSPKPTNPLLGVLALGQSLWYDNIRRTLITSGELQGLIDNDGLRGVTSNPSIFEKAIAGSSDYNDLLLAMEKEKDRDAKSIYETLAIRDIQDAAGVMFPVYERTNRRDGYISLEVSPYLANDTAGTLEEARRLWKAVSKANVMIKVPATPAGVPAIKTLIGEGINVNVTLLFSMAAYETVAEAYISGIEALISRGGDPRGVASVASFFISRIDSAIDALLTAKLKATTAKDARDRISGLLGKAAIANARLTYRRYQELVAGDRWTKLAAKGAQTQRLLWASTSTKNPNYRDVVYVEELIGRDTVDTVPSATFDAFRDHGVPRASLAEGLDEARRVMEALPSAGVSMKDVTDRLLTEGVTLFADAFDKLLGAVEKKRKEYLGTWLNRQTRSLPADLESAVAASLEAWRAESKVRRLWALDASLWSGEDESKWLGWLGVTDDQVAHIGHLKAIAEEVRKEGFTTALLLGMGGSSLCPEVMKLTFGKQKGFPELHVLDSTDPAQVMTFEKKIDLAKTIFIVSSKSGGTLEPNIFKQYFFER
ncbi:MAG: bifunctional transaldolase/phosoglucose isomerase, partial [Acidobacteria bacterium]|nr:bifunctional transaldolase/phosoglucose isomerase [Acidobacteriota bacterium]